MAGNDLQLNKLSFNVDGFMSILSNIYSLYLDELSQHLQNVIKKEIITHGNGSKIMRLSAVSEVKETKREITAEKITLEAGIDLDKLKSKEPVFVRVSVVLHGNLKSGPLRTKPGEDTWNKHVRYKSESGAQTVYLLPRAMWQEDNVMVDIVNGVSANVTKQIEKHVKTFARNVSRALNSINISAFTEVR